MQRYVRLVAGLFILMTVATPIMNWIKGDIGDRLAEGLQSVEKAPGRSEDELALIEAEGEKLRDGHRLQAERLAAARLEAEIKNEVERSEQRPVRKVVVGLERDMDGALAVAGVMVELEPASAAGKPEERRTGPESLAVEAVADVDIRVEDVGWESKQDGNAPSEPEAEQAFSSKEGSEKQELDRETRSRISALIAGRFGLPAGTVDVRLPDASVSGDERKK
jgi:stage III sporulation protein AF